MGRRRASATKGLRPEAEEVARRIREGSYRVDLERLAERLLPELDRADDACADPGHPHPAEGEPGADPPDAPEE